MTIEPTNTGTTSTLAEAAEKLGTTLLALSLSIGVAARVQDNIWLTWLQVCEAFQRQAQRVSDTKDGLLIAFAHFANDYRLGSQVTDLFAVCLDFDHQTTEAFNNSILLAKRLSTRGIVHTTWSDDPVHLSDPKRGIMQAGSDGDRCWRIIIPLDTPVTILQWADTWNTFAMAFEQHAGAIADRQCRNPNRRYYAPTAKAFTAGDTTVGTARPFLHCWGE